MASAAPASAAPEAPPLSARQMWAAGGVLALTNFMVVLDTSIANVSVPHIAGSLAISPDQGTWVITSYSVAEAICVPLTGWLASRFGAVRSFIFCMIGFGIFSIACGSSVSLSMLVACRIGQGLCGGPMMPLTQTLMMRIFPPKMRPQAMGLWAMTTVAAPVAGPLLGGTISDELSWHWIFFINIPVCLFCIFAAFTMLRRFETPTARNPIDKIGLALLVVWVGALQIMLDIGRDHDWFGSTEIWALAIIAAVGFVIFVIWELTDEHPIVDLRVFRHRGFTVSVLSLAFIYAFFFSAIVVTPQWLQGFLGYTASWSGYVLAWQGVFAMVMAPLVGKVMGTGKIDPRLMVTVGVLWLAFSMSLRTQWTSDASYWTFALPHILNGFGMPTFFVPITMLAMASVLPVETASAAGLQNFMRTLSGAVGTSVATTIWANSEQSARADLVNIVQVTPRVAEQLGGAGTDRMRNMLSNLVEGQAVALATIHLFEIATVTLALSALMVWLIPRPKRVADTSAAH